MKRLVLALLGLLCASPVVPALAGPLILTRIYEDAVLVESSSTSSGTDALIGATPSGRFGYGVLVAGVPVLESPALSGATVSVSSLFGFSGEHTLTVAFSQTGLSSLDGQGGGLLTALATSFATNFFGLTDLVKSVTLSSWIDTGNGAFATTTLLGSATFTDDANASSTFTKNVVLTPGGLFSETIRISAVFGGGGAAVASSAQIVGAGSRPIVAVTEPASLLVFGTALILFGCAMTFGRRKAPAAV